MVLINEWIRNLSREMETIKEKQMEILELREKYLK